MLIERSCPSQKFNCVARYICAMRPSLISGAYSARSDCYICAMRPSLISGA